jgi:K+ transporter
MRKCIKVLLMLVILLTGCNSQTVFEKKEGEKNNIHNALSQYLSLLVEKDFKSASEYVIYFTDKPYTIQEGVAKEIWEHRVKNQNNVNSSLMSFNIQTVEPSDEEKDFAQALVEMTTVEKGIKSSRNIYVHLERVNEKWKVGYYFREDHSKPDDMTNIYTGYISQEEIKTFNKK